MDMSSTRTRTFKLKNFTRRATVVSFFLISLCSCRQSKLLHDLQELDANRVIVHLAKASITASKSRQENNLWIVEVATSQMSEALKSISDAPLAKTLKVRDTLLSKSLISSRLQETQLLLRQQAQDIERLLEAIPLINEAKVSLSTKASLGGEKTPGLSSSAVLIVEKEFSKTHDEIAQIVSGASGVSPSDVTLSISVASPL